MTPGQFNRRLDPRARRDQICAHACLLNIFAHQTLGRFLGDEVKGHGQAQRFKVFADAVLELFGRRSAQSSPSSRDTAV